MAGLRTLVPVFPLPNVVLFPNIMLPLHIFEPRYRQMVRDTMGKERRLIGVALFKGDWKQNYYGNPEIFSVGCAGEMLRAVPLPDGRFNILLLRSEGVSRSGRDLRQELPRGSSGMAATDAEGLSV